MHAISIINYQTGDGIPVANMEGGVWGGIEDSIPANPPNNLVQMAMPRSGTLLNLVVHSWHEVPVGEKIIVTLRVNGFDTDLELTHTPSAGFGNSYNLSDAVHVYQGDLIDVKFTPLTETGSITGNIVKVTFEYR